MPGVFLRRRLQAFLCLIKKRIKFAVQRSVGRNLRRLTMQTRPPTRRIASGCRTRPETAQAGAAAKIPPLNFGNQQSTTELRAVANRCRHSNRILLITRVEWWRPVATLTSRDSASSTDSDAVGSASKLNRNAQKKTPAGQAPTEVSSCSEAAPAHTL